MLERLLDRMSLRPTRHRIVVDVGRRETLSWDGGSVEMIVRTAGVPAKPESNEPPDLCVIKFIGAAGRAEDVTENPLDVWDDLSGEIWVANPPGFGNSPGRASLTGCLMAARAIHDHVQTRFPHRPLLLLGNSLGGAVALAIAANHPCCGLILRDPADIAPLMRQRFGFFPRIVSALIRRLPEQLDASAMAARCRVPAVIVSSRKDRIVPVQCQDRLIESYAGPKQIVPVANAKHMGPMTSTDLEAYAEALRWLRSQLAIPNQAQPDSRPVR